MKIFCSVFLALAASVILIQNISAGDLYTWTDKNGVVHIANSPTQSEKKQAAKYKRQKSKPAPAERRKAEAE